MKRKEGEVARVEANEVVEKIAEEAREAVAIVEPAAEEAPVTDADGDVKMA